MRSLAQIEASRRNGAKSRGPLSPEGKALSSQNARRFGLTAQSVLLTSEDHDAFNQLAGSFYLRFQPADDVEREIVDDMIVAIWHRRRDRSALAALLDHEMDSQAQTLDSSYTHIDHATRYALAYRTLADQSRSLHLMNRYQNTHRLTFHRALAALLSLKNNETNPQPIEDKSPPHAGTQEPNPGVPPPPETQDPAPTSDNASPAASPTAITPSAPTPAASTHRRPGLGRLTSTHSARFLHPARLFFSRKIPTRRPPPAKIKFAIPPEVQFRAP